MKAELPETFPDIVAGEGCHGHGRQKEYDRRHMPTVLYVPKPPAEILLYTGRVLRSPGEAGRGQPGIFPKNRGAGIDRADRAQNER